MVSSVETVPPFDPAEPTLSGLDKLIGVVAGCLGFGSRASRRSVVDVALTDLLMHAATLNDNLPSKTRQDAIRGILVGDLHRDAKAIELLLADSRAASQVDVGPHQFTRVLNKHLSDEERLRVLEKVADVIYADDAGPQEERLLRLLGGLLEISDRDRGEARMRAKRRAARARLT